MFFEVKIDQFCFSKILDKHKNHFVISHLYSNYFFFNLEGWVKYFYASTALIAVNSMLFFTIFDKLKSFLKLKDL